MLLGIFYIYGRKLDWMYAGPAGHVNTDDYLTGRAVDKTFEHFKLGGAEPLNLGKYHSMVPKKCE